MAGTGSKYDMSLFTKSRVCLAPMAGYSDAPFRLICSRFGADFTMTEMVSADGLIRGGEKTKGIMETIDGEGPVGVQLFGSDPDILAEAAKVVENSRNVPFIDLNFGCPVKKVIRKNGGAAIMRDLELMGRICSSVSKAVDLPVTAKIRSGWSGREENFMEAGKLLEEAGAAAVTLHPRYRTQGFSGEAAWDHIARLRGALSIPVVANGDVREPEDYFKIVDATGCSLVMIGRGAFGRPWIFRDIKEMLAGRKPGEVTMAERIDLLGSFLDMEVSWKGERLAVLELRKFYRWYLRGRQGLKEFRARLSVASSAAEVRDILRELREEIVE